MKKPYKAKKWNVHFDHWWSEDVKEFGAPIRLHIRTPWVFIMIGEKSQIYDWKTRTWTKNPVRWSYITMTPIHDN